MPEEEAPKPDPDAARSDRAGARAVRPGGSTRARGEADSRRETHDRRGGHGDLGSTDGRASARRAGGAGDRVAAVVEVSPAFAAAIRAAAREAEAEAEAMCAEATLGACEAAFEHMHTKVRAAARALIHRQAPPPAP
jgi:hypothetical protein